MEDLRKKRKKEHIKYFLELEKHLNRNVFDDVIIIHNCLSEINPKEIDISTNLQNIKLRSPIIINAMTGGFYGAKIINKNLARIAKELDIAMAVGSQKIALDNPENIPSFSIVRKENPDGIIFANLSSEATVDDALKAIDMIEADAIQIHLNMPQEIIMSEGRTNFANTIDNIKELLHNINVPVIIKEVGFGVAAEDAQKLVDCGANIIDIGGAGGTNFICIENLRQTKSPYYNLEHWGIPTAASLVEVVKQVGDKADVISSGGLKTGLDVVKSLALGANATAFAGTFLYILMKKGPDVLKKHILKMEREIKYTMAMAGAKNIAEIRQRPLIVEGRTYNWLKQRGFYK